MQTLTVMLQGFVPGLPLRCLSSEGGNFVCAGGPKGRKVVRGDLPHAFCVDVCKSLVIRKGIC